MEQYITKQEVQKVEDTLGKKSIAMRRWYNALKPTKILQAGGNQHVIGVLKQTHVKIAPSKLGGVGVKAIRPIAKGTDPFPHSNNDRPYVMLSYEEINALHVNVQNMIQDFHLVTGKEYDFSKPMSFQAGDKFPVPVDGLNNMNVSWFLNHDELNANVGVDRSQVGGLWSRFVTLQDIQEGEELRYNYNAV